MFGDAFADTCEISTAYVAPAIRVGVRVRTGVPEKAYRLPRPGVVPPAVVCPVEPDQLAAGDSKYGGFGVMHPTVVPPQVRLSIKTVSPQTGTTLKPRTDRRKDRH